MMSFCQGLARTVLAVLAVTLLAVVGPTSESFATENENPVHDWTDDGVLSQDWYQDPSSGFWTTVPVSNPDSPYRYSYTLLCVDGNGTIDLECQSIVLTKCQAGENGRLVQWLESLKILDPPVYENVGQPTCIYDTKPRDVLAEIAATIQHEFEQSPVSPARVTSQPGPNTLRGANTNFYAQVAEQAFDITLLGQKVHIAATPVEYTWNYGDGASVGPVPYPGAPLPEDRWGEATQTSHNYTQTGDYSATVTTHFRGTYSVNGSPPLPIPGQGNFTSAGLPVSVWRSTTRNYADNCLQNPNGQGC